MAFTPTVLQEAILETQRSAGYGVSENERRLSKYGALEAHRAGTDRMIPASTLAMMKEATSQATSIDVFQRVAPGAGTSRACEGTGTGTTVNVPLVYNGFREEFKLSWIEHEGNRTKYQEAFNYMFAEKLRNLYSRIDTAAIANLEANVATGGGVGSIYAADTNPDHKAVPLADHSNFFNNAMVEMMENDFNGPFFNVSTTSQVALQRFDAQQGANNDTNLSWMQTDYVHYPTNRFAAGAGNTSASYLFDPSAVGMITWINQLSRAGKDIGTDEWTSFADPLGLLGSLELKVKKGCEDNSGSFAGAEADYAESFVMYVEVAFVAAYDSVLGAPIFRYNLKA